MEKLIITAALTGAEVTKVQMPYLPISPDEIADEAYKAWKAGASIVHIHARNPQTGEPTSDLGIFREIATKIRKKCDVIINITTGGAVGMTNEERIAVISQLKPELASLDMGSMNYYVKTLPDTWNDIFMNSFATIEYFAKTMRENGTVPEVEVFDLGMINNAKIMIDRGDIDKPPHVQFALGVLGGIHASTENLLYMVKTAKELLPGCSWSVLAPGKYEFPMATVAIIEGGHVRVGFEDNIYLAKGVFARSNAELVERVVRLATELNREIATPEETRKMLKLKGSGKVAF